MGPTRCCHIAPTVKSIRLVPLARWPLHHRVRAPPGSGHRGVDAGTCVLDSATSVAPHENRTCHHPEAPGDRAPAHVQSFELQHERMALLEGIARGEMAVAEGTMLSHAQAKSRMARWLK